MERKISNWYRYAEMHTDVGWKGPVKATWSNLTQKGKLWGCLQQPCLSMLSMSRDEDSTACLGNCAGVWLTSWWNFLIPNQFSWALLVCHVLQLPTHLGDHLLDLLQYFNVCLAQEMPKLDIALQVQSHRCQIEGSHLFPWPASCTVAKTALSMLGCLHHKGKLLTHVQLVNFAFLQSTYLASGCPAWGYSLLAVGFLLCHCFTAAELLEAPVTPFLQPWGLPKEQPFPQGYWSVPWT